MAFARLCDAAAAASRAGCGGKTRKESSVERRDKDKALIYAIHERRDAELGTVNAKMEEKGSHRRRADPQLPDG